MAILTESGRVGIAASVKQQTMYLAWGTGEEDWGNTPPTDGMLESTALMNEIGRRVCKSVQFCKADDEGEIITPTGRFTASTEPTNMLHINVAFDFTDGEGYTIREFGIFTGTVPAETVLEGQEYLLPTDITDKGQLLALERVAPIFRQAMTREIENFVITF